MSTPDDIAVPLHTSLTTPILLAGTPRSFAILNATLCAVIGLGLGQVWVAVPVGVVAHSLAVWLTRQDPWWLDVMKRHLREKAFYQA